jgi:predicted HTH transcriptional regulator
MLDFNDISQYRENNRLEAKAAIGGLPRSLWETYSAFANTNGGVILLGVEEQKDKSLRAVALPDPEKLVTEFWSTVNNQQKINVNILTDKHVKIVESDGHRIVLIEVPRADRRDKPVYIGADPFAGSYRRSGEGDYHCTRDEVRNMMRDQTDISQDSRVLGQLGLDVFDYESVRRYRMRLQNVRPNHVWENLEPVLFLQKLGCVGRTEDGILHPTAAGLLMFGFEYEIVKEFPGYFLDYQEHDDDSTRWTDRIVSNLGDWSGNIFDFYFRICIRITQEAKTPFGLYGFTRIDETPVHKALREALANALIHADYYERQGLVIHQYPQNITISNPGSFRISIGDAASGLSDPRNYTLVKMFNLLGIGERAGSGIPSIYAVWENQGWKAPVIEERFKPDRTVLSLVLTSQEDEKVAIKSGDNEKVAIKSGDNDEKVAISEAKKQAIVDYLTEYGIAKTSELSVLLGVNVSRTKVYLNELTAEGIVVAAGANRNRTYQLK